MKTPGLLAIFFITACSLASALAQSASPSAAEAAPSQSQTLAPQNQSPAPQTTAAAADLGLVPKPRHVEPRSGSFAIAATTRITIRSEEERPAAAAIAEEIESATGRKPRISTASAGVTGAIFLTRLAPAQLPSEA